jgi:acyl-coenzyme A thioesterase PaaI-like protein
VELRAKEGQLEDLLRAGQQALKSQPFSALIGAKLTSLSEGKAVLEVPIREELLQQNGYVHGGVISYIADNALTFASGETLVARASMVNAGRRQAVCRCEVFTTGAGRKERFCAAARGTSVSVSAPRET